MDAVISGIAGKALLLEGDSLTSFDVEDMSHSTKRYPSDLSFLFGDARDLRLMEGSDIASIKRELQLASDKQCALDLALISLDPELPTDIRIEAVEDLEVLLTDEFVEKSLESVLYGRPLPEAADINGAIECCNKAKVARAKASLKRLKDHQPSISEVSKAWDAVPTNLFGGREQRTEFQQTAVTAGLFRALALTRETQATIGLFFVNAGLNTSIQRLPNYRDILQRWSAPFREPTHILNIKHEEEDESRGKTLSQKGRGGRRKGIDRAAVLRNVESQKKLIIDAMERRDLVRVRNFLKELVEYQLQSGEPIFAAKSLCDLAAEAKALGMFELQVELTEQSTRVKPNDAWSWRQHADALLSAGQPAEALRAYEQADAFGGGAVAKNGLAETLKALGRLNDALEAYDTAIATYPWNVVVRNGRADTLKALGRLNDALEAYDAVIATYPESVVARSGRAETLKALGRLNDALEAYDAVIATYPDDVVARSGRADTLKALGRLNDALEAYNTVIATYPENVVARSGRADTLKALGRLNDALEAYDAIIATHPENVVVRNGRAETLKALGRLNDSLDAYDAVIATYPENVVARSGRADTLKALGRLNNALGAYDDVIATYPENVVARNGRADTLKALGRLHDALGAYDAVIATYPENVVARNGRADTLKALGRLHDALEAYDAVLLIYPQNMIARNGRSCVLGALQRYDEALVDLPAQPTTLEDWIGFHIRGMIMMRLRRLEEAIQIFERGVAEDILPLSKQYFRTALAMALMRQKKYDNAERLLSDVGTYELQPQVDVLLVHCFGEEDRTDEAREAFKGISTKPWSISDELIEELHRRYILKQPPQRSDDWVFDQEIGSVLVVANQQAPTSNYLY